MTERAPREAEFRRIIEADPDITALLAAMRTFEAPDLRLVSGALFQAVWNVLEGRPRGHGILDVDPFHFDPDTSEKAEDRWIKRAAAHFAFAPPTAQPSARPPVVSEEVPHPLSATPPLVRRGRSIPDARLHDRHSANA